MIYWTVQSCSNTKPWFRDASPLVLSSIFPFQTTIEDWLLIVSVTTSHISSAWFLWCGPGKGSNLLPSLLQTDCHLTFLTNRRRSLRTSLWNIIVSSSSTTSDAQLRFHIASFQHITNSCCIYFFNGICVFSLIETNSKATHAFYVRMTGTLLKSEHQIHPFVQFALPKSHWTCPINIMLNVYKSFDHVISNAKSFDHPSCLYYYSPTWSCSIMGKGRKAKTALPDCEFLLVYPLFYMPTISQL